MAEMTYEEVMEYYNQYLKAYEIYLRKEDFTEMPEPTTGRYNPAPDEVALTIMEALLSNPSRDNSSVETAIATAWTMVPQYYIWRNKYAGQIAPRFMVATNLPADTIIPDGT